MQRKTRATGRSLKAQQSRPVRIQKGRWAGRLATEQRWERFVDQAREDIRRGRALGKPPRYLSDESSWKRHVYSFVLSNTADAASRYSLQAYAEELILGNLDRRLPRSPTFEANPFHWVLSALAADGTWKIDRRTVFRFGRQLLYARAHRVPVQLLIGFLYQAGTLSEVVRKAANGTVEIWRDEWVGLQDRNAAAGS